MAEQEINEVVNVAGDTIQALLKLATDAYHHSKQEEAARAAQEVKPTQDVQAKSENIVNRKENVDSVQSVEPVPENNQPDRTRIKVKGQVVYDGIAGQKPTVDLLKNNPALVEALSANLQRIPSPSDPSFSKKRGSASVEVNGEKVFELKNGVVEVNKISDFQQQKLVAEQVQPKSEPNQGSGVTQEKPLAPSQATGDFLQQAIAYPRQQTPQKVSAFEHFQKQIELPPKFTQFLNDARTQIDPAHRANLRGLEVATVAHQILNTTGGDKYQGKNYTIERKDDVLKVSANDGRGEIFRQQYGVIHHKVEAHDMKPFNNFSEKYGPKAALTNEFAQDALYLVAVAGAVSEGQQVLQHGAYRIEQKGADLHVGKLDKETGKTETLLSTKDGRVEQSSFTLTQADGFKKMADHLRAKQPAQTETQAQTESQSQAKPPALRR
jgi:hypothetical protein